VPERRDRAAGGAAFAGRRLAAGCRVALWPDSAPHHSVVSSTWRHVLADWGSGDESNQLPYARIRANRPHGSVGWGVTAGGWRVWFVGAPRAKLPTVPAPSPEE